MAISLPGIAHAQIKGETRNVPVRMVLEPWGTTAIAGLPSTTGGLLVPPPKQWTGLSQAGKSGGLPNSASQAQAAAMAADSLVGAVFPGPSDRIPPDSQIAAGPTHLVSVVNSVVAIFTKSGTVLSTTTLNAFFQSLRSEGCDCFDSRILYDQADNRFILSTTTTHSPATLLLAVSQTSDPTGNWNKFAINPLPTGVYDMPTLGLSSTAVYFGYDVIQAGGGLSFEILVVGLAELLTGSSQLKTTRFQNVSTAGSIQGAITYGDSPVEFLVQTAGQGSVIHVYKINTTGTPTLTTSDINVPFYKQPPPFQRQPGGGQLPGSPSDFSSAVWRNNSLWTAHSVGSDDGTASVMRWYEIDTTTMTVKQMGSVTGAGDADFGAITVLPDGAATLIYTTSSPTQFASAGYAHRSASDPPGTMPISSIYQAGATTYTVSRWGDYSGASPDPDGKSVWGIAELALTSNTTSTSIAQILSSSPSPNPDFTIAGAPTSNTVTQGQSAVYSITVGSQNGFQNAVTLSCANLPANASCSFSPSVLTPVANPVSAQLTIATAAPKSAMSFSATIFAGVILGALWIPLAVRIRTRPRRKLCWTLTVVLALALYAIWQIGCGGVGSSSNPPPPPSGGTPAGTYTVTITGNSGSLQHSTTVGLVVR